jgi:hypothetical protein
MVLDSELSNTVRLTITIGGVLCCKWLRAAGKKYRYPLPLAAHPGEERGDGWMVRWFRILVMIGMTGLAADQTREIATDKTKPSAKPPNPRRILCAPLLPLGSVNMNSPVKAPPSIPTTGRR